MAFLTRRAEEGAKGAEGVFDRVDGITMGGSKLESPEGQGAERPRGDEDGAVIVAASR